MISTRFALFSVVTALFFSLAAPTLASSAGAVDSDTSSAADSSVVLRYQSRVLRGPDAGPSVTVHDDGRVRVHRPAYFVDAGEYELRLPARELENLVAELLALGLADVDTAAIRSEQTNRARARLASRGSIETRVGAATSLFELRLAVASDRSDGALRRVERRLLWRGLAHDARSFPEIEALANLAAAEERLREFFADPRLAPVEEDAR